MIYYNNLILVFLCNTNIRTYIHVYILRINPRRQEQEGSQRNASPLNFYKGGHDFAYAHNKVRTHIIIHKICTYIYTIIHTCAVYILGLAHTKSYPTCSYMYMYHRQWWSPTPPSQSYNNFLHLRMLLYVYVYNEQ